MHFLVLQKMSIENNLEDKTKKHILDNTSTRSIKIAPLFRMVSVPDEQVPGLKHLVNRPQSWVPQPRSKTLARSIFISLVKIKITSL